VNVIDFLNAQNCRYELIHHKPAYTAEQLARVEQIPKRQVAKCVVVEADGRFYLCVLPADRKIDFLALQKHLKVRQVRLADEKQMAGLFADSQVGAEAPFGNLYDLPTLMDKTLARDKEITFPAGSHETSIHMTMDEYQRLARPMVFKFSYSAEMKAMLDPYFDPYVDPPFGM